MIERLVRVTATAAVVALAVTASPSGGAVAAASPTTLRVCADADYMPYSSRDGRGFENKIALAVGKYLGEPVAFTYDNERKAGGFDQYLDRTLRAHKCDLVMDVPYATDNLSVTEPYYISSYVFVYPKAKHYAITSMDSPALKKLRIGFEEDTPGQTGLQLRALIIHAQPFDIGSDDGSSPAEILDAVSSGKVNVAVTWEPSIGYFLKTRPGLAVVAVPNSRSMGSPEQYAFPMAMGTRPDDKALAARVDRVIAQHKSELTAILTSYGVKLYRPGGDVAAL